MDPFVDWDHLVFVVDDDFVGLSNCSFDIRSSFIDQYDLFIHVFLDFVRLFVKMLFEMYLLVFVHLSDTFLENQV